MVPEIKKILFATDLSKNARHAFNYAVSAAHSYGATITIPVGSAYGIIKRVPGILGKIRRKENFFNLWNHRLPPLSYYLT